MTGGTFQAFGWRVAAGVVTVALTAGAMMANIQFFKGAGSGSPIFSLGRGKFYDGTGSGKVLCTIDGDRVYEGAGSAKMIFNVSGGKLFRGSGSSDVACNWSGGRLSVTELAAAVWLLGHPY
jgi:hypothetical protein